MSVRRETAEKEQEKRAGGFARQERVRSYPKVSQRRDFYIITSLMNFEISYGDRSCTFLRVVQCELFSMRKKNKDAKSIFSSIIMFHSNIHAVESCNIRINNRLYLLNSTETLVNWDKLFGQPEALRYSVAEFPGDIVIDNVSRGRLAIPLRLVSPSIRHFRKVL